MRFWEIFFVLAYITLPHYPYIWSLPTLWYWHCRASMSTRTHSLWLCKCYVDCVIICICLATLDYPFWEAHPTLVLPFVMLLSLCLLSCSFNKEQQSRQAMRARHKTHYISTSERTKRLGRFAYACLTNLIELCILCISYTHLSLQNVLYWQVQSRPHPSNGILRSKVIVPQFTDFWQPKLHCCGIPETLFAPHRCRGTGIHHRGMLTNTAVLPWQRNLRCAVRCFILVAT